MSRNYVSIGLEGVKLNEFEVEEQDILMFVVVICFSGGVLSLINIFFKRRMRTAMGNR